jgi:hypothetical protein
MQSTEEELTTTTTTTTTTSNNKPISFKQKGTGLHIDLNPYNLWETIQKNKSYQPLDRFRPFQSFVALTDGSNSAGLLDGGLEVVPGFHQICEHYFQNHDAGVRGMNVVRIGPYNCKFSKKTDTWVFDCIQKVQRIPDEWSLENEQSLLRPLSKKEQKEIDTAKNCAVYLEKLGNKRKNVKVVSDIQFCKDTSLDHKRLPFVPVQQGDWVFWDIRLPHQNSDKNLTDVIRSVFYHGYLTATPEYINTKRIDEVREKRGNKEHLNEFPRRYKTIEADVETVPLDSTLSRLLYHEQEWDDESLQEIDQILQKNDHLLTQKHIDFYNKYGYVVVENLFTRDEAAELYNEIVQFAKSLGTDVENWKSLNADNWSNIGGSFGGMVEFCWQKGMQKIRIDERPYTVTSKLMKETWCNTNTKLYKCPFRDQLDPRKLWLYIDRTNLRLPNKWIAELTHNEAEQQEEVNK